MPPIQNFRYTDHAEYQLFNRQVTKQAVERTVQYPDERQADKEDSEVIRITSVSCTNRNNTDLPTPHP